MISLQQTRLSLLAKLHRSIIETNKKISRCADYKIPNNETIGMTVEKAICKCYGLKNTIENHRINDSLLSKFTELFHEYKQTLDNNDIMIIEHVGKQNKHVDFILKDNSTMSVKTLKWKNGKLCPQIIGQPTYKKWDMYFNTGFDGCLDFETHSKRFDYIKCNINDYLNKMLCNFICCDFLLIVNDCNNKTPEINMYKRISDINHYFDNHTFTFTKDTCVFPKKTRDNNVSYYFGDFNTTVKTESGKSIGEIQFHQKRNSLKFRFYSHFIDTMIVDIFEKI